MASNQIPEREPVTDHFTGSLLRIDETPESVYLLAPTPPTEVAVVQQGTLIIRYGLRYLGKPHIAVVPGLVALDYGAMMTGEQALEFILQRHNRYPRSDVIGYRNDGHDEMIVLKYLDFDLPLMILVYPDAKTPIPTGQINALIATEAEANTIPPRILANLPRFNTLTDWRNQRETDD